MNAGTVYETRVGKFRVVEQYIKVAQFAGQPMHEWERIEWDGESDMSEYVYSRFPNAIRRSRFTMEISVPGGYAQVATTAQRVERVD